MFVPPWEDLVDGLHRVMMESVVPAIEDEFALAAANQVCAQLKELSRMPALVEKWLTLENAELRKALQNCAALVDADPAAALDEPGRKLRTKIDSALQMGFPPDQPSRSTQSLVKESHTLSEAAESAVALLHELQRRLPQSNAAAAARKEIRRVICMQAKRRDPATTESDFGE